MLCLLSSFFSKDGWGWRGIEGGRGALRMVMRKRNTFMTCGSSQVVDLDCLFMFNTNWLLIHILLDELALFVHIWHYWRKLALFIQVLLELALSVHMWHCWWETCTFHSNYRNYTIAQNCSVVSSPVLGFSTYEYGRGWRGGGGALCVKRSWSLQTDGIRMCRVEMPAVNSEHCMSVMTGMLGVGWGWSSWYRSFLPHVQY